VAHRIVNTKGAAIQVAESSAGEPAFVFLHYWGGSSGWEEVINRLGGKPRAVAFDQRGWGKTVLALEQVRNISTLCAPLQAR
jgi:pimeloyl-ACP methyl ester carboxylesterase